MSADNMPVAGKTGTTEDYNDVWFVGYTPYYTCAVWAGYDNNEKLVDYEQSFHKNLWRRVMNRIHADLPYTTFEMPSGIESCYICSETGLLAREYCDGITEYFSTDNMPTEYCYEHFYIEEEFEEEILEEETLEGDDGYYEESDDGYYEDSGTGDT